MFFIDIAVPRDVDPEMNKLDGIFVYDIDDLQQVVARTSPTAREAERAEAIVDSEVEKFQARLQTLDVVPTIVSLQEHLETIARRRSIACAAAGHADARTGNGGRRAHRGHRQQNHAHADHHLEDGGARISEATTVIDLVRKLFNLAR